MNTRIVFLEGGKPAQGLKVKSKDSDAEAEWTTNNEGQLALDLSEGTQELVVYHGGSWVPHIVNVQQNTSLLLVDLEREEESLDHSSTPTDVNFLDIGRLDLGERYVFEKMLGHGGMGMVIRARDRLLNRSVAIKLLSDELRDNDEAQQIFLAEARHLATLNHPNLVAVHDISKVDERVFMVIEYIKGETIERLVQSLKRLSEPVALKLAIQLTRVVAYLHDHGIIHRDLKPANAMVRHDGTLKLVDFGLARHFDELYIRGTRVRGTPAYMSPEQIRGDHLTPASDIYQLGVCFFEMITGRLPFQKGDISYAHVHSDPPRASSINPKISPEFDELIDLCLRKPTNQRPKSTHNLLQMLQALHRAIDNEEFEIPDHLSPGHGGVDDQISSRLRTSEIEALSIPTHLTDPGAGFDSDLMVNTHAAAMTAPGRAPARGAANAPHTPTPPPVSKEQEGNNNVKLAIAAAFLLGLVLMVGAFASNHLANQANKEGATPPLSPSDTVGQLEAEQVTTTPPAADKQEVTQTTPIETTPVEVVTEDPVDETTPTEKEPAEVVEAPAPDKPKAAAPAKTAPKKTTAKKVAPKKEVAKATTKEATPTVVVEKPEAKEETAEKATEKNDKRKGLFDLSESAAKPKEEKKTTKGLLPMN